MTERPKPTEAEITYAIEYALRSEGITANVSDGCGGWDEGDCAHITADDLHPFTMRLLQALNVI